MLRINEIIEKAQLRAIETGLDQYVVSDMNRNITHFANHSELKKEEWIIGKVCLVYRDKILEAKFVEFPNLIRFICSYKDIEIIATIIENEKRYNFTILKNKNGDNKEILFKSIKEVKEYISSFDKYSEKDRIWFLTK
ncbi:MAG: hypothetical protein K2K42_03800 [Eubacterium sp.]|nr:hypothetical protein [Eubacterium sp.]